MKNRERKVNTGHISAVQLPEKLKPRPSKAENAFQANMEGLGYRILKNGWPDYLVQRGDGTFFAVEVKARTKNGDLHLLTEEQALILDVLRGLGLQCFVSDGEILEPYSRVKHRSPIRLRRPPQRKPITRKGMLALYLERQERENQDHSQNLSRSN